VPAPALQTLVAPSRALQGRRWRRPCHRIVLEWHRAEWRGARGQGAPARAQSQGIMAALLVAITHSPAPSPARRREFASLPRPDRRRQGSPFAGTCPKDDRSCQPACRTTVLSSTPLQRRPPANSLSPPRPPDSSPTAPPRRACTPHSARCVLTAASCLACIGPPRLLRIAQL
jgi:hypothetical protein